MVLMLASTTLAAIRFRVSLIGRGEVSMRVGKGRLLDIRLVSGRQEVGGDLGKAARG